MYRIVGATCNFQDKVDERGKVSMILGRSFAHLLDTEVEATHAGDKLRNSAPGV